MVGCSGCGSKLVFDIAKQQMKCSYCGKFYAISEVAGKSKDADEAIMDDGEMEVTMFTCSQCGAEIIADSDEAVTWCSYCGSPATLKSRLCRIRKPDAVIPFKISKEECTAKYLAAAKKQIYAPRELIEKGKADGFRGIYMPYWTYSFERKGNFSLGGKTEMIAGDYKIVTNYLAEGCLSSHYEGLSHDASLAFDDSVSEQIVPYWTKDEVPFDECYLNGFYGDAADRNEQEYSNKMYHVENELVVNELKNCFRDIGLNEEFAKNQIGGKQMTKVETSATMNMYPVWFMSYKAGNRVAYTTMNGQTGKMYTDFPASMKRFFGLSALAAIPIFFLLYLFATPRPETVLFLALCATLLMSVLYKKEVAEIYARRFHLSFGSKKKFDSSDIIDAVTMIGIFFMVFAVEMGPVLLDTNFMSMSASDIGLPEHFLKILLGAALSVYLLIRFFVMRGKYMALNGILLNQTNGFYLAMSVLSTAVFVINPVRDEVFYAAALCIVGALCLSAVSLIRGYNELSSVKPKQFQRNGGDRHNV